MSAPVAARFSARSLALAFGWTTVVACGGEPTPTLGPGPTTAQTVAPPADARPDTAFVRAKELADLRDRIVDEAFAYSPTSARNLGFHDYDGKVDDVSQAAIDKHVQQSRAFRDALDKIDADELSADDALDRGLLRQQIDLDLFNLLERDEAHKLPQFYEQLFNVSNYVEKKYAPVEIRGARLVEHEEAALAQVPHLYENLKLPLGRPVLEVAAKNFAGFASYLRGDVAKMFANVGDETIKARFAKSNAALAKEAEKFSAWLKAAVPGGDRSYALGKDRYLKFLKAQEGLDTSLDDFKKMGEDDLARNKTAYEALLPKVKITKPAAKDLLATATAVSSQARRFILDKGIVALATEDDAEVRETPPYARWNSASIEMSGPFDATRNAFYYITLPDPKLSKKEQEDYLMNYGTLWSTTVHEVYPGHFVQLRWLGRAPTKVQKMSGSYSFVEGWAHYSEQLMIEQGFVPELPAITLKDAHAAGLDLDAMRVGQLSDALLRDCRFVVSVGLHTEDMTVEQAAQRFIKDCHIDPTSAKEQAVRGTFDPGYFAYTLGKLQILKLRAEAQKVMGDKFTLQRFHDALLAHGAAPVALIHDRVLKDLAALRDKLAQ